MEYSTEFTYVLTIKLTDIYMIGTSLPCPPSNRRHHKLLLLVETSNELWINSERIFDDVGWRQSHPLSERQVLDFGSFENFEVFARLLRDALQIVAKLSIYITDVTCLEVECPGIFVRSENA